MLVNRQCKQSAILLKPFFTNRNTVRASIWFDLYSPTEQRTHISAWQRSICFEFWVLFNVQQTSYSLGKKKKQKVSLQNMLQRVSGKCDWFSVTVYAVCTHTHTDTNVQERLPLSHVRACAIYHSPFILFFQNLYWLINNRTTLFFIRELEIKKSWIFDIG